MSFDPFRTSLLAGGAVAALAAAPAAGAHTFHRDHVLGVSFDLTAAARTHGEGAEAGHGGAGGDRAPG